MKQHEAHENLRKWKEEGDVPARDKVVLAHMKTAEWWVGKYTIPSWCGMTREDALQVAYEAVLQACQAYRIEHDKPNFYSCAISHIRRQLHRAIKERGDTKGIKKAEQGMLSIHDAETVADLDFTRSTNCQYGWSALDPKDFIEDVVSSGLADRVRQAARTVLNDKELAVYRLHYEIGHTYERTGSELGIGRQYAARLGRAARRKINRKLEGEL